MPFGTLSARATFYSRRQARPATYRGKQPQTPRRGTRAGNFGQWAEV
jgi:hypothetical protein